MNSRQDHSAFQHEIERLQLLNDRLFYEGNEWLETNGLGGWASSSITGCNTRRYHGLLVAAIKPPTERMMLVSKIDENIVINNQRYELGTNLYHGDVIHPQGYRYLSSFSKRLFPRWRYQVNEIVLEKTITMVQNENTTLILYDVVNADDEFTLELLPLIAARGYHALQQSRQNIFWDVQFQNGIFKNQPYEGAPQIYISVPGSAYQHHPQWFYKFNYVIEKYRGLDYEEDLFNHGTISVQLKSGDKLGIIISTEGPLGKNAEELFEKERERKHQLVGRLSDQPTSLSISQKLTLAADQFIVKRDADLKTIVAGYHWFTDWGRDTMISLPGLCLTTGRYEDAKKILAAFAKNVSMGMLPNRFRDRIEPPEYNNVDGTLWYFISIYKYLQYTDNKQFVLEKILPVLKEIIEWHFKGTRYNIHVDSDGLLYAGEKGQQLTWMDAKIGDWVVTPRMGKPVEIQALWYNALRIFAELLRLNGEIHSAGMMNQCADQARKSFLEKFWFESGDYLYDVIDENGNPDRSLRPNQLFAAGLPFALIDEDKTVHILKSVEDKLYTPVGLRTLPRDDSRYVCVYSNNGHNKDACYHQGTVWSWLLGPYVDAIMYAPQFVDANGLSGKELAKKIMEDFKYHLDEACTGTISEIFDADPPHYPRGCVAQAWSVGEMLRVIKEYKLEDQKTSKRTLVNKTYFTGF